MTQAASLRLDNGLTVLLRHDPQATEAAALIRVASGSDHEPARWPGLAHLLEHLLFSGSRDYRDAQRLMSWVPAQGGRLNATTHADRTAFFFSLAPAGLEPGLARLVDMLTHPLFAPEALAQEVAVIDAEYRLLRGDAQTLGGVAQRHLFSGPPAMHRFHVGDRISFGDDLAALRQALCAFHQQYYHAAAMTLWLLGPQPLDALAQLARRYGARLPAAQPLAAQAPARLRALGDAKARIAGATQLRLTFALNQWHERDANMSALLQQLLSDEAEGGLLAQLRAQACCDGVSLQTCWRGGGAALIAVCFDAADASPEQAARLEAALRPWLAQAAGLSAAQLEHYAELAQQRFADKSALDRLREEAFGFAPPPQLVITQWRGFLTRLQAAEVSRLWLDETLEGETQSSAGFDFISVPFTPASLNAQPPRFRFAPFPPLAASPALPAASAPLLHLSAAAESPAVLTLRPRPEKPINDALGYALQASLRALAASLTHQGAMLSVERRQGIWQLQLSGDPQQMRAALAAMATRLRSFPAAAQSESAWRREQQQARGDIPVRRLLNQLPRWLMAEPVVKDLHQIEWQAALTGGDAALREDLARLLSTLPGRVASASRWLLHEPVAGARHNLSQTQGDTALLLFCPLTQPDSEAQLAWRLLALICQPLFFQRLRVEQQIGYVASCSFHQAADREGILFALQSPQLSGDTLCQHTQRFLSDVADDIARLTAQALAEKRTRLWQQLQPEGDALARARQTLAFAHLISPTAQATLQRLDVAALLRWHRVLCDEAYWQRCILQASG